MTITIAVNGLSLVHRGSGGVSSATLPDVCRTPPDQAPLPYANVAESRDLAQFPASVRVDGDQPPAHSGSCFARSRGDEAGAHGGVVSGAVGGRASWLTHSPNVQIEGFGVCRLTDKMLHNNGNTLDCAGVLQAQVSALGHSASPELVPDLAATLIPGLNASQPSHPPPYAVEIALPFLFGGSPPAGFFDRARELHVTYFRLFLFWREGEPISVHKDHVQVIHNEGFGVQMSVGGGASPWTQPGGRNCHGICPSPAAFATFFANVVDFYKGLGVKRFSVWNEPNHKGFLRCGVYWKTSHAKKRIEKVRQLKREQENAEKAAANAEAERLQLMNEGKTAEANAKVLEVDAAHNLAKKCNNKADAIWDMKLSHDKIREIQKRERALGNSVYPADAYKLFDLVENAKLYRRLYEAAYAKVKDKGIEIWFGELASREAFPFLRAIFDPRITGTRKMLRAHALALHPYQYLVSPNQTPSSKPSFLAPTGSKEHDDAITAAKEKRWPSKPSKRKKVIEDAKDDAGIGTLLRINSLVVELARNKKLARPGKPENDRYKRVDLCLTEFGYHRERSLVQADRQVPESRRAVWVQFALRQAIQAKAKQFLYYSLTYSPAGHVWDTGIVSPENVPDTTFVALRGEIEANVAQQKVKLTQ